MSLIVGMLRGVRVRVACVRMNLDLCVFACMRMYVYMNAYIFMNVYTYTYVRICKCNMYIYIYIYVYIYIYMNSKVYTHVCFANFRVALAHIRVHGDM
jgi:hypothetical protein